jgi:hypothetical protein
VVSPREQVALIDPTGRENHPMISPYRLRCAEGWQRSASGVAVNALTSVAVPGMRIQV